MSAWKCGRMAWREESIGVWLLLSFNGAGVDRRLEQRLSYGKQGGGGQRSMSGSAPFFYHLSSSTVHWKSLSKRLWSLSYICHRIESFVEKKCRYNDAAKILLPYCHNIMEHYHLCICNDLMSKEYRQGWKKLEKPSEWNTLLRYLLPKPGIIWLS